MLFNPEGKCGVLLSFLCATHSISNGPQMSSDCVLGVSLGKCFFFLALLHWQMEFDIVPWEQIGSE